MAAAGSYGTAMPRHSSSRWRTSEATEATADGKKPRSRRGDVLPASSIRRAWNSGIARGAVTTPLTAFHCATVCAPRSVGMSS
jgi:hypothetical protein